MTVSTTGHGGTLAGYDPDENLGFEDVDQSDIQIPRITIDHKTGEFVNSLSGARYTELRVIILGQVKQRIMWAKDTDEGDKPLCKSPDHHNGFPSVSEDLPRDKRFPWQTSGLKMADFPGESGINGLATLPCGSCSHKDWDNPLTPGQKKPSCDEQFTFPMMYSDDDGGSWATALFSVQRTGIKPAKTYVSSYAQTKTPMFRYFTRITLNMQTKGSVVYCIPAFARLEESDRAAWDEYATQYRSARELVRMAPQNFDETPEDGDNENGPAPVVVTTTPVARPAARPVAKPTPAPVEDDPWSAPAPARPAGPTAAPVVAAPAPEADDDDLPF